jgi:hypothetical protein
MARELWRLQIYSLSHQDSCHGSQKDGVAAEEGEEFRGRCEDFPLEARISQALENRQWTDLRAQTPSFR